MGELTVPNCQPGADGKRRTDQLLRRQAIQIAAMLPEDLDDALAILEHAKTLMREFVGESEPARVIALISA
jgi:hypothetical protein